MYFLWFRQWLGSKRRQAITWTNDNTVQRWWLHACTSSCCNKLTFVTRTVYINIFGIHQYVITYDLERQIWNSQNIHFLIRSHNCLAFSANILPIVKSTFGENNRHYQGCPYMFLFYWTSSVDTMWATRFWCRIDLPQGCGLLDLISHREFLR